MWDTYTPDGRLLVLRKTDEGWLATCLSNRAEAPTADEAIRGAVGAGTPADDPELEAWIAEHVAALESA
jgi:pyruvoyl-dependent arginine decarboxylase (PvlArgDC)